MYDPTITWEGNKVPLFKAFIAAQSAAEAIKKASSNPAFKTKYADLSSVIEAVVPALNKAGVGVMQFPHFDGETVTVQTVLCHESGSNVTHRLTSRPSKLDAQGIGSAITYGRRYSLLAISGAAPEDDDGKAASGPVEPIQNGQRFDTPKPPTISEWALKVENAMRAAQTLQALQKTYSLASGLFAQLDTADPERLVELETLYRELEAAFVDAMEREPA